MRSTSGDKYISSDHLDRLISAHDGDIALLYLYRLYSGNSDLESAAAALCRTMGEMQDAAEKLERMELSAPAVSGGVQSAPAQKRKPLPPADELPQYRAEDIVQRSRTDSRFSAVVTEAQQLMGHTLSSADLGKLFGIYDYLALPAEVILELLNHCAEENRIKYGGSRRLSMRFIEKEAYVWVHNEILTMEQAEAYIQQKKKHRELAETMKDALNIRGRDLAPSERKYIDSWLDMGFREDALSIAYDRTVTNTGSLKWSYMNKILQSWNEKGLHTAQEIAEKDGRPSKVRQSSTGDAKPIDMDELRSILDRI